MSNRRDWMIGLLSLTVAARVRVGMGGEPAWQCPACGQCTTPERIACPVPDTLKKSTTQYGCKADEICLLGPCCEPRPCGMIATHCPALWEHWRRFTDGVVRERRVLTKVVDTKEVPTCKCEVRYVCPCCRTQFVPKG